MATRGRRRLCQGSLQHDIQAGASAMTINDNFTGLRLDHRAGVELLRDRLEFGCADFTKKLDVTDLKTTVSKISYLFQSDP